MSKFSATAVVRDTWRASAGAFGNRAGMADRRVARPWRGAVTCCLMFCPGSAGI